MKFQVFLLPVQHQTPLTSRNFTKKKFIRNNKFIRYRVTITFPYAGVSVYSASAYPKVHPELLAEL